MDTRRLGAQGLILLGLLVLGGYLWPLGQPWPTWMGCADGTAAGGAGGAPVCSLDQATLTAAMGIVALVVSMAFVSAGAVLWTVATSQEDLLAPIRRS